MEGRKPLRPSACSMDYRNKDNILVKDIVLAGPVYSIGRFEKLGGETANGGKGRVSRCSVHQSGEIKIYNFIVQPHVFYLLSVQKAS